MDKKIIDTLIKFGLITNIGVNADSYKDVDDLINKGVVTIPGAKTKIDELLKNLNLEISKSTESTEEIVNIVSNDTTINVITDNITIELENEENEVEDIKETEVETAIEVETKNEVIKSEVEDIKETEVIVEEPKNTTTKRTKKQNKAE